MLHTKTKEEKKMIRLTACLSAAALVCFAASEIYSYKEMHYDREKSAYVLSKEKYADFKEFSTKTFETYQKNGYHSKTEKDWFALSEAMLCLDKEVEPEDSCIEWAVERERRVGVQYTWDEGDGNFYSKIYYCTYDQSKYPTFKVDNDYLIEVNSSSVCPG